MEEVVEVIGDVELGSGVHVDEEGGAVVEEGVAVGRVREALGEPPVPWDLQGKQQECGSVQTRAWVVVPEGVAIQQ